MKWFKHDADANVDAKLMKVRHKYGAEGYGLYWYCIELIAGEVCPKNITFELEHDAEILALELRIDQLRVQEMMSYMVNIGLFEESEGAITCMKLAKRLDDTNAKNPQIREILSRVEIQNTRRNSETLGESPKKSRQIRLDKTKQNNRASKDQFAEFWDEYPKKKNRGSAESAWKKVKPEDAALIMADLTSRAWPENHQFIPYPSTYINGKAWLDEDGATATTGEVIY